jgi:hypothetical protein
MEQHNFEWLEGMIDRVLKPGGRHRDFAKENTLQILEWTMPENAAIVTRLKIEVLKTKNPKQLKSLLIQQCNMISGLLNKLYSNQQAAKSTSEDLFQINAAVLKNLDEVLCQIEADYAEVLHGEQRVPFHQLETFIDQEKDAIIKIKEQLNNLPTETSLVLPELIFNQLTAFEHQITKHAAITRQQLLYFSKFIEKLQSIKDAGWKGENQKQVITTLVQLNLNSPEVVNWIKTVLDQQIKKHHAATTDVLFLRSLLKEYHAVVTNEKMALIPASVSLKSWIVEYLSGEIDYLEHKNSAEQSLIAGVQNDGTNRLSKVLCNLSADQVALVLRAADDVNAITAKSLNAVFKTIVPFLSTAQKENPSWESMRVKSYTGEDRDKEIAIQLLAEMIRKIREY